MTVVKLRFELPLICCRPFGQSGGEFMPTFMDVQDGMHVALKKLRGANKKDLEAQKGTGVEYVLYGLDSRAGKVFCLAKGPNKGAVAAVHMRGGLPATELYEVS